MKNDENSKLRSVESPTSFAEDSLSGCCATEVPNKEADRTGSNKPAPSAAKIAANQQNARKSTGPTSSRGKRNSARNSLKHGLFSHWLVIVDPAIGEDPKEFGRLLADVEAHYSPHGLEEKLRCEELACAIWKRRRLLRYESGQLARALALNRAVLATVSRSSESESDPENYPEVNAITDHLLVLSKDDLDRKARSESVITRQMNLALSELERLLARRKGSPISASFSDNQG
jgi:hypothetical protein